MGFKCGIVGLPNVGKSTFFNALTRAGIDAENFPFCTIEPNAGVVPVPDPRQEKISELVQPQKQIATTMEFVDIAGLVAGASKGEGLGNQFLANIRETDAIAHVVRCFEDENAIHVANAIDPAADIEIINTELALSDLDSCEKQLSKVTRTAKGGDKEPIAMKALLENKLLPHLNEAKPIRGLALDDNEQALVKSLFLLTSKPTLYIANVDEDGLEGNAHVDVVRAIAAEENAELVVICNKLESEIKANAILLSIGLALSTSASANLIMGGGFNSAADLALWEDASFWDGGISISPCCSLNPQEGAGYLAFTGNSASVDTDWYGGAFQFVGGLTIGSVYEFSYYWGARGANNASDAAVSAGLTTDGFNTANVLGTTHEILGPVGTWTKETQTFIAQDTFVFVDFSEIATNSRSRGVAIDNASLVDIPVPGTLALFGLGLLGVASRFKRS